ncbi:MAG: sensor histidine kinase [Bacteroidales bacterium]|nr:sensor histidine kinase [Bacteroidales bacterium]
MKISKKTVFKHIRIIIIVTLIGFGFSLIFSNLSNLTYDALADNLLYSFIIGFSLLEANTLPELFIDRIVKWEDNPKKRIMVHIIIMLVFSSITIVGVNYLWFGIYEGNNFYNFIFKRGGFWIFVIQMMVTLIIIFALYSIEFFKQWRVSVTNEEILKREKLSFEYESLKNQVNPHFLFNSLNTLSSLVYVDQDKAVKFIKQLSEVYRYVLEIKDIELVPIETEIEFVESYCFLQKIRFSENLKININLNKSKNIMVIPLSIQLLIENAIKHNVITKEKPLTIDVFNDEKYIVVKNNLQIKKTIKEHRDDKNRNSHVGLENIKLRYKYLSKEEVIIKNPETENIESEPKEFIVKIPLIKK